MLNISVILYGTCDIYLYFIETHIFKDMFSQIFVFLKIPFILRHKQVFARRLVLYFFCFYWLQSRVLLHNQITESQYSSYVCFQPKCLRLSKAKVEALLQTPSKGFKNEPIKVPWIIFYHLRIRLLKTILPFLTFIQTVIILVVISILQF